MKFKIFCLLLFLFLTTELFAFPKLSDADIKIQQDLISKINQSPRNADYRFELAMEFAATGWIELGWEQLKLVPKLEENYKDIAFKRYSDIIKSDPKTGKHTSDWHLLIILWITKKKP